MSRILTVLMPLLLTGCADMARAVQHRADGDVAVAKAQRNAAIGVAQWQAVAASSVANAETTRSVTIASIWANNVQLLIIFGFIAFLLIIGYRLLTLYYHNRTAMPSTPVEVLPPTLTPAQIEAMRNRAAQQGGELKRSQHGQWFIFIDGLPYKRLTVRKVTG